MWVSVLRRNPWGGWEWGNEGFGVVGDFKQSGEARPRLAGGYARPDKGREGGPGEE